MLKVYKMNADAWKDAFKAAGKKQLDNMKEAEERGVDYFDEYGDEEEFEGCDSDLLMEDPLMLLDDNLEENDEHEAAVELEAFYSAISFGYDLVPIEDLLEDNDNDFNKVEKLWNDEVDEAFKHLYKALEKSPKTQEIIFDPDSEWYQDYDEMVQEYFSDEEYCVRKKYIDFEAFEKAFRNKEVFHPAGSQDWSM